MKRTEWLAQTISAFIAATAPFSDEKSQRKLLDAVAQIDIFAKGSKTMDAREAELYAMRGEKVADRIEDDPRFARVGADPARGVEAANGSGSFEALMGGWLPSSHGQALDTRAASETIDG